MYLYLYFKYFFGWLLVLVLKILLQSILPNTASKFMTYPSTRRYELRLVSIDLDNVKLVKNS